MRGLISSVGILLALGGFTARGPSLGVEPRDEARSTQAERSHERPNLLLVVADDLSDRDVDRIPTPHFDELSARGMRFRRAYANPTCSPARWSLVFGEYHAVDAGLSCQGGSPRLAADPERVSLPRMLRSAGYRTALFGKWHLGFHSDTPPIDGEPARWELAAQVHGFEVWRAGMPANVSTCGGRSYRRWTRVDDGRSELSRRYNTHAITEEALAWIEERRDGDEPWFAMVAYQAPHGPFHAPPGTLEGEGHRNDRRRDRANYELMVQSFDSALGDLLESVDPERTVVLVVGDNGTPGAVPGPGQRAARMKGSTFEDGIRVPMAWAGPGISRGLESSALVHFVDVLPTMAERLGLELAGAGLHGLSLATALLDPAAEVHEYVWCGVQPRNPSHPADYAVVTQRYKYRESDGEAQLYDLLEDPEERRDLSADPSHGERRASLAEWLARHRPAPMR